MFYRVDFVLAVIFTGFIVGALLGGSTANVPASRLARGYYVVVVGLTVLRIGAFAANMLMSDANFWGTASGFTGDLLGFMFGALFGVAARRKDAREVLTSSPVFGALCVTLQSGYSVAFLKFIVIAEILGGMGLLLPWAVLPALTALTVDMFGAVLTHIHNGDPLNDSTGAIGMLLRLIVVGVLLALRQRNGARLPTVRISILRITAATIIRLLIAVGGSVAVRHLSPPDSGIATPITK